MKIKSQKTKIEGFLHVEKDFLGDINFSFYSSDMTDYGYICVKPVTIEIQVESFDYNLLKIDALEKTKRKIMAESQSKINTIDDEIEKLMSIEDRS